MAAKSVVDVACEPLDERIAELRRVIEGLELSKHLIRTAHFRMLSSAARRYRSRRQTLMIFWPRSISAIA